MPYSCEVAVRAFKESEELIRIQAEIYVAQVPANRGVGVEVAACVYYTQGTQHRNTCAAQESQKGILIGNKGSAIKRVGVRTRKQMETFFQKQALKGREIRSPANS